MRIDPKVLEGLSLTKQQTSVLDDIGDAVDVARKVFEVPEGEMPTPEMVFGCHKLVLELAKEPEQEQAIVELLKAVVCARHLFNTPKPTADMVFGCYRPAFDPE